MNAISPASERPEIEPSAVVARTAIRIVAGLAAASLVLTGASLPLWHARLKAPQYPEGLGIDAYGTRVAGDLTEINGLNHYIGMAPFDLEDFPELGLWPYVIALGIGATAAGTIFGRGRAGRLARLTLWTIPIGVLADIQLRLFQYGHNLDPDAALRVPPFTPWVIGPTKTFNFVTWSYPGLGLGAVLGAAFVLSLGARLVAPRGARSSNAKRRRPGPLTTVVLVFGMMLALSPAAVAQEPSRSDAERNAGAELAKRIASARDGDVIVVESGTYAGDFLIDKPITLQGDGHAELRGTGNGTVLTIRASGVVVRGLSVSGSGTGPVGSPAGILITGNDVLIEEVQVRDSYTGIAVVRARSTRIVDTSITGRPGARIDESHSAGAAEGHPAPGSTRGDGIFLNDARWTLIRGVELRGVRDGIYLSFGTAATIDRTTITGSRYGVHSMYARHLAVSESSFENNLSGAVLMYGGPVVMVRNTFRSHASPSTGFGVLLKDVTGADIARNVLVENRIGMQVEGPAGAASGDNHIVLNTIALNQTGIALFPNAAATFAGNSFVENTMQVLAQGTGARAAVAWMYQGAGNFWSTYQGFDRNGDGVGDLAHNEGGILSGRIARSPLLAALATSPALRLADAVQQRWVGRSPLVVDQAPLMSPLSPPLPAEQQDGTSGAATRSVALLAMVAAGVSLWRMRSTRASYPEGAPRAWT